MTCRMEKIGDTTMITCGPRRRQPPCTVEGCGRPAGFLCDFPLTGAAAGKTCSKRLCEKHAVKQKDATDLCPTHDRWANRPGFSAEGA